MLSVGLAVYNGEPYLREAVDSILAQTFTDFELVISDNASTDATAEICAAYAAADPRVRYHRNSVNIGGVNNQNQVFEMSRGRYFRWAAHDDTCAPTLFEECVRVLEARPDIILCYTSMVAIGADGHHEYERRGTEGTANSLSQRFREVSYRYYPCDPMYGVIRSEVLRETRLQMNYTGSDRTLLCELALRGPFYAVDQPLFYKRFHEGNAYKDWRGRMAWFDPSLSQSGRVTFPNWLQLGDLCRVVSTAPIGPVDRIRCYGWFAVWTATHLKGLVRDAAHAGYMMAHSKGWRAARYADQKSWL